MEKRKVLVVDDDSIIRKQLVKETERNYLEVFSAASGREAMDIFTKENIDVFLLDIMLPDSNGLDILKKVKKLKPECQVVVITGEGNMDMAIKALRRGAIDYIEKPIEVEVLNSALGRALEQVSQGLEEKSKNSILLIDDEKIVITYLQEALKEENYIVHTAHNGHRGIEIIEKHKVDVVVSDISMGDITGIDVIKAAKAAYEDIEVIMLTGHKDEEMAVKSLRAGAFDYLTKPINLDELFMAIERALERVGLYRSRMYRSRELKISSEIVSKMNEELERRVEQRTKDLKNTQAQLVHTSKLATLGEMSAGLAHEINQPLGAISFISKTFRKLNERNKLDEEELKSGLDDIDSSVVRMHKIIKHIRTFARQDDLKFAKMNVNDSLNQAVMLMGEQLRLHEIDLKLNLTENLPDISGETYQLEQVWINLITNARDALDGLGEIKPPADRENAKKEIKITSQLWDMGGVVRVTFEDNAGGMPAEVCDKIFTPFFTTKEVGQSTGLGLSISYGIIESHKANIQVRSKEGRGTTFVITFPKEVDDG